VTTLLGAAGLFAGGGIVGILIGRRLAPPGQPAENAGHAASQPDVVAAAAVNRELLLLTCAWVYDRVTTASIRQRLAYDVQQAGAELADPVGAAFDPDRHQRLEDVPTDDTARAGTVAKTLAPGLYDDGRVLRRAQVAVYKAGVGEVTR
jgi:hypothetical protein